MLFKECIRSFAKMSGRLFHKRSIIIISEHKTNHFAISGRTQLISTACAFFCLGAGSYFTGSYMAARSVLAERDQTIKSVATARVESNFDYMGATLSPQNFKPVSLAFTTLPSDTYVNAAAKEEPELQARIAFLETQVRQLTDKNEEIIHRVKEKTNGKIADLESVIRKTGLDPKQLQLQLEAAEKRNVKAEQNVPQGGPFVPADLSENSLPEELFAPIDRLSTLNRIIETLPLASPIDNAETHSLFGRRLDPFTGRIAYHTGLDLSGPVGSKVAASNDGRVVSAGYNGAYGNMIDVDHGFGIVTRYGHLSQIKVKKGQEVHKGQIIGIQGSTGRSTGAHLHYEVRYNDRPLNPANFLKAGAYVSQN